MGCSDPPVINEGLGLANEVECVNRPKPYSCKAGAAQPLQYYQPCLTLHTRNGHRTQRAWVAIGCGLLPSSNNFQYQQQHAFAVPSVVVVRDGIFPEPIARGMVDRRGLDLDPDPDPDPSCDVTLRHDTTRHDGIVCYNVWLLLLFSLLFLFLSLLLVLYRLHTIPVLLLLPVGFPIPAHKLLSVVCRLFRYWMHVCVCICVCLLD